MFRFALRGLAVLGLLTLSSSVFAQAPAAPAAAAPAPPPPSVKVGDAAPDFTLPWLAPLGQGKFESRQVRLADFKGKQNVVVAFFPAAFSPGCTKEMQQYQATSGAFTAANTTILGVSVDSTWANKAFREQLGAEFPILSDWKKDVARQFGLLDEASGFARRATFVIDKAGIVRKVDIGRDALDPSGVVGMCQTLATQ